MNTIDGYQAHAVQLGSLLKLVMSQVRSAKVKPA